jgi:hypothetical protein
LISQRSFRLVKVSMPVVDRSYILNLIVLDSLGALGILALFPVSRRTRARSWSRINSPVLLS